MYWIQPIGERANEPPVSGGPGTITASSSRWKAVAVEAKRVSRSPRLAESFLGGSAANPREKITGISEDRFSAVDGEG